MLAELIELAGRLQREGEEVPPPGYRTQQPIRWVIHLQPDGSAHAQSVEIRRPRPSRQRSGTPGPTNLKPYLLVDDARYALGLSEPGQQKAVAVLHEGFLELLDEAREATGDPDLETIAAFLRDRERVDTLLQSAGIRARDWVTFAAGALPYPFERESAQRFWADYLAREIAADGGGECLTCGARGPIVRTLPVEVVIAGQPCSISSFNLTAFQSFGKKQTTNAPLCFRCAEAAANALNFLADDERHHAVLMRDQTRGRAANPLRTHLAVFWLKGREPVTIGEQAFDLEELLAAPLTLPAEDEGPEPRLSQLASFLNQPWRPREGALVIRGNAFYLAVLSANNRRLVVREWLRLSLDELRENLRRYLSAARLVTPDGTEERTAPLPAMLAALARPDPNLVRGLLRTAYQGAPPPPGLLSLAVLRLQTPRARDVPEVFYGLAAAIQLVLTYGKEVTQPMEDPTLGRDTRAHLCGRLLAVLEEVQSRAASTRLATTMVHRFYAGASTAPAGYLPILVREATVAHMPKIRRLQKGYKALEQRLEALMEQLEAKGGFPPTLPIHAQADFALGFYVQRAEFARERAERGKPVPQTDTTPGAASAPEEGGAS